MVMTPFFDACSSRPLSLQLTAFLVFSTPPNTPLAAQVSASTLGQENRERQMTGDDGSCASRAARAAAFGAASGGALGAARATWSPSAPVILQGRSLPALMRTGEEEREGEREGERERKRDWR